MQILLHVVNGFLDEMEIYRVDGSPPQGVVRASEMTVSRFEDHFPAI